MVLWKSTSHVFQNAGCAGPFWEHGGAERQTRSTCTKWKEDGCSMIRSLFTGESGLKSHQTRMDVIGNNIANVNTVGYKTSRATFEDMLSQKMKDASASNGNIGSTNPEQVGLGVQTSSIDIIEKDGAPVVTGKNTDLCLSGDGMFVVRRGGDTYYTRDGAFSFDAEGNYILPGSGHFVQGWMAKDGVIDTTSATEDIKIPIGRR